MTNLQIFNFERNEVRTQLINDEIYFVGKDVAEILGYSNTRDALAKRVDDEDKGVADCDTLGGSQKLTVINESGLYSLVLSSKLPNAKKFKRWVTKEVLPSIRKHGLYANEDTLEQLITSPEFGIKLLTEIKKERQEKEEAQLQLKEQEPQVIFAKAVEVSKNSVGVKILATILKQNGIDIGQNRMFQWLRDKKYLSSRPGKSWNMPTQKAMDLGLFELKPNPYFHSNGISDTKYTPLITGKGQVYFVNKFQNELQFMQEELQIG